MDNYTFSAGDISISSWNGASSISFGKGVKINLEDLERKVWSEERYHANIAKELSRGRYFNNR